ncbi:gephyrin-like molybdotransferase Glp [Tabrizicola sp.]|jgi:molybdopterin molybdotransferase|uniref:molybdopterin molybdotransferase MoeA n=1 Tax=Tabrizicola sp. TaxID=2005166 RepID=UPI0027352E2B|nr:gephyrin-like molybdotransferase Glp [Tabrizicola sp.]MDP3194293.1 molybdopterin molybdotransferase MoeA [Tabrizicola sp.]
MTILQPITPEGCGCDRRDTLKTLLSVDDALALIHAGTTAITGSEMLATGLALGRILADPVAALQMTPPFDNAAMDGYAVATSSLSGPGPWHLPVTGRVPAGQAATPLSGSQASRIFTGAPIPAGADAVVMQEDVHRTGSTIRIDHRPKPGLNIRRAGSELAAGALVLQKGRRLGTREIAVCAAAGASQVRVRRRLRVALLVTGDEIQQAGGDRSAAQIWDVNTPMLRAALTRPDIELVAVETGLDSRDGLFLQIAELTEMADLLITTGGISVGEEDHVKPALTAMGAEIIFSGVAIKPGKPISFGQVRGAKWLGLPGNPLSAFITWHLFGEALVKRMTGEIGHGVARRHVVISQDILRKPGRCEFRPAYFTGFDPHGREVVGIEPETHSSRVAGLSMASGLIYLPADAEILPAGALVEFQPFCPN